MLCNCWLPVNQIRAYWNPMVTTFTNCCLFYNNFQTYRNQSSMLVALWMMVTRMLCINTRITLYTSGIWRINILHMRLRVVTSWQLRLEYMMCLMPHSFINSSATLILSHRYKHIGVNSLLLSSYILSVIIAYTTPVVSDTSTHWY
jgi:hypothetical protein